MSEEIKQIWLAIGAAGIGGGTVGSLLTIFITHRLTISRERMLSHERGLASDKKPFILAIDTLIETTKNCEIPNIVKPRFRELNEAYLNFRPHLKDGRLAAYEDAWKKLQDTTWEEVVGSSGRRYKKTDPELHKIQGMIISRLEALREIIHDT